MVRLQSSSLSPSSSPACNLAITPEGYSRRQSKVYMAKSIAKLLGLHWLGWSDRQAQNTGCCQVCYRHCWPAAALESCYHSCNTDSFQVLILCEYLAETIKLFSSEMKFLMELVKSGCWPKKDPSLFSIFRLFIGLWVKIGTKLHVPNQILCKAADLSQRPV